jgi:hypothetical protein
MGMQWEQSISLRLEGELLQGGTVKLGRYWELAKNSLTLF